MRTVRSRRFQSTLFSFRRARPSNPVRNGWIYLDSLGFGLIDANQPFTQGGFLKEAYARGFFDILSSAVAERAAGCSIHPSATASATASALIISGGGAHAKNSFSAVFRSIHSLSDAVRKSSRSRISEMDSA